MIRLTREKKQEDEEKPRRQTQIDFNKYIKKIKKGKFEKNENEENEENEENGEYDIAENENNNIDNKNENNIIIEENNNPEVEKVDKLNNQKKMEVGKKNIKQC